MSQDREPKTYSEYESKRLEIKRSIDYNLQQISYHNAKLASLEQDLVELETRHEKFHDKLVDKKTIDAKLSIQRVADMLAVDKQVIEDKILTSKAQKLYEQFLKGYK